MIERQPLAVVGAFVAAFELQRLRIDEDAAGVDDADVAALGELSEAAGERVDDLLFAGADLVDRDLGLAEFDAPFGHLGRFAHHLGDVQQGLRGDAAAQQAGAAETRVGFDDGGFQSEVGGEERGRIAARSAAEDDNFAVIRHNPFAGKAVTSPNILVYPAYPDWPMGGFGRPMAGAEAART